MRITEMADYIIDRQEVTIDELVKKFNVSIVTIRRDLTKLANDGIITKVYGGAKANTSNLTNFEQRIAENNDAKDYICKMASRYIHDGDSIYIDSGTTVKNILKYVDQNMHLTVITNNLYIIDYAKSMPNVDLILIGNIYNKTSNSFIFHTTEIDLNEYNITKAFMATSGVSIDNGLTNKNFFEVSLKTDICKNSDYIFLLTDSTKFGKSSLMTYWDLNKIDYIIIDTKPHIEYIDYFNKYNIELIY